MRAGSHETKQTWHRLNNNACKFPREPGTRSSLLNKGDSTLISDAQWRRLCNVVVADLERRTSCKNYATAVTRGAPSAWFSDEYFITRDRMRPVCACVRVCVGKTIYRRRRDRMKSTHDGGVLPHVVARVLAGRFISRIPRNSEAAKSTRKRQLKVRFANLFSGKRGYPRARRTLRVCFSRARIMHQSWIDARLLRDAAARFALWRESLRAMSLPRWSNATWKYVR